MPISEAERLDNPLSRSARQVAAIMVFEKFVQIGGIIYINRGRHAGKLAAIVNVVDQNRLLVDGPCSDVKRDVVNIKQINLTTFRIDVQFECSTEEVRKAWEEADISAQWAETKWAKNIAIKKVKANMSDFDRFKLMKLKQKRRIIINGELKKLKKARQAAEE